jgi:hypothetical protein
MEEQLLDTDSTDQVTNSLATPVTDPNTINVSFSSPANGNHNSLYIYLIWLL